MPKTWNGVTLYCLHAVAMFAIKMGMVPRSNDELEAVVCLNLTVKNIW